MKKYEKFLQPLLFAAINLALFLPAISQNNLLLPEFTTPIEKSDTLLNSPAINRETDKNLWQLNGGPGFIGGGVFFNGSVQIGFNSNFFISLGMEGATREARNKPSDYDGGLSTLFTWGLENEESAGTFNVTLGVQSIEAKSMIFSIEAGPSIGSCTVLKYTRTKDSLFGPNYTITDRNYKVAGVAIKGRMRWAISEVFGVETGLSGVLNKRYSYFGLALGMSLGKLK